MFVGGVIKILNILNTRKYFFLPEKEFFLIEKETSVKYSQANIHINHLLRNLINFNKIHIINIGGIVEHHCLNFVLQLM
jgi:hypothetical protein